MNLRTYGNLKVPFRMMNVYYGDKGYWAHPLTKPNVAHGGARLPFGAKGDVYAKPDPLESTLDPELRALWKDGYVMKVMKPGWNNEGEEEWKTAEQLRQYNLNGMVLPEARGVMRTPEGDRTVLFSKYAGPSVAELTRAGSHPEGLLKALEELRGDVQRMAQQGVYPADTNIGNILYNPGTQQATLIDMGGTLMYDDRQPHNEHLGGEDEEEDYMDDLQKAMQAVRQMAPVPVGQKRERSASENTTTVHSRDPVEIL